MSNIDLVQQAWNADGGQSKYLSTPRLDDNTRNIETEVRLMRSVWPDKNLWNAHADPDRYYNTVLKG